MLVQLWNAAYPGMEVPCAYRDSEAGSVFASTWCSLGFSVSNGFDAHLFLFPDNDRTNSDRKSISPQPASSVSPSFCTLPIITPVNSLRYGASV